VLRGTSVERLPELIRARELFDLIYIDGSHTAIEVLADAALLGTARQERPHDLQ
jgi:hypothetical protein